MAKIAVVVPVYKVPFEFLDQCIRSIIHQSYTDLEIIIVDDGSPEEWALKCDSFLKMDKRIRVFHKKNGGLSDARNYGINIATSEWITFVDGDDWIENNFFELFFERIQHQLEYSDIYYFSGYRNYPHKEIEGIPYFNDGQRFCTYQEREELQTKCFTNHVCKNGNVKGLTISSAWAKIYKTLFLKENELFFPIVPYDEDSLYFLETLEKARNVEYIAKSVYHYRYTEGSIVNRYRPNAVKEQEIYIRYIFDFAHRFNKSDNFINCIYYRVLTSILLLIKQFFYHVENNSGIWCRYKQCSNLLKTEPYHTAIHKIEYRKLRRNPKLKLLLIRLHLYYVVEFGRKLTHRSV